MKLKCSVPRDEKSSETWTQALLSAARWISSESGDHDPDLLALLPLGVPLSLIRASTQSRLWSWGSEPGDLGPHQTRPLSHSQHTRALSLTLRELLALLRFTGWRGLVKLCALDLLSVAGLGDGLSRGSFPPSVVSALIVGNTTPGQLMKIYKGNQSFCLESSARVLAGCAHPFRGHAVRGRLEGAAVGARSASACPGKEPRLRWTV